MANKKITKDSLPLVSIVILNWNGLKDTLNCLESVKLLSYSNFEIIVVDNGSEGSLGKLESDKEILLVKNAVNLGFAGGQNSALPYCNGEYILLLNNDATIHPDYINIALESFSQDKKIAVVGGKSYSVDENGESTHGFYSIQRIDPVTADVHTYNKDNQVAASTVTVSGSAVMIRRDVIDSIGYFDNRFFAYYEETDLFARYLRAGYKIIYNPELIIWHKDGASTRNKRFMYYYLMLKNQFLFAYKNFDAEHLRMFKKTYYRNFRRSLWVFLKDRSSAEAIHKARVRSTIWNMLNIIPTHLSRINNLKINPDFNYSRLLIESQPIDASLVINGIDAKKTDLQKIISSLVNSTLVPKEIVVVTKFAISIPDHSSFFSIRNIVDKKIFDLTYREYGFMSSNTNTLIYCNASTILNCNIEEFSLDILKATEIHSQNESVLVLDNKSSSARGDLSLSNGGTASVFSIRKSDLTNFLVINDSIKNLSNNSLGEFVNWCVMECMPISRINLSSESSGNLIETNTSKYPVLSSPLRWRLKKILRNLHLSRIFAKVKKIIKKRNNKEIIPESNQINFEYIKSEIKNTPVFINTRDRVDPLKIQLDWFKNSGLNRIAIIDNDSTYSELLDLFDTTSCQVIPLGRNGMHRAPWESFAVRFIANDQPYILTDPDILPTKDTPSTTINKLYEVLHKYPSYNKVGVALKIDDIPDLYQLKSSVIEWESRFWDESIKLEKDIYGADIDTTLALYKPNTWWFLSPSIRVAGKYAMKHEPWYQDLDNPTNDMMYYRARASNEVSTWTKGKLPKHHLRALKKEGLI